MIGLRPLERRLSRRRHAPAAAVARCGDPTVRLLPRYRDRLALDDGLLDQPSPGLRRLAVAALVDRWLDDDAMEPGPARNRALAALVDDLTGYGPLEELLADPSVTEVMVNGPRSVYVEAGGRLYATPARFRDAAHVRAVVERLLLTSGRRLDEGSPMVDARLPDGSRLNAVLPPVAVDGPTVTIRRFPARPLDLGALVDGGFLSPLVAAFLHAAVLGRCGIVVTGATGAGKTTLLAALCALVPADERLVLLEEVNEIDVEHPHVVRLECRPARPAGGAAVTLRDLVRNSLRLRPDRLVVGEVRGAETFDMVTAMNSGHEGSMTTLHASGPDDAVRRLETLMLQALPGQPAAELRGHALSCFDVVVHCERDADGARIAAAVAAVEPDAPDGPVIPLFAAVRHDGATVTRVCGHVPARALARMARRGVRFPPALFAAGGRHLP